MRGRATREDNALSDKEWLDLGACILSINRADTHENVRYQVLMYLMDAAPYQTAAFFVSNTERSAHAGALIAQPVGEEHLIGEFEQQIDVLRAERPDDCEGTYSSLCSNGIMECCWVMLYDYADENGLLGTLVVSRAEDQSAFTHHDSLVLDALGPHIAYRLKILLETEGTEALQADMLFEEYRLTHRELEVLSCVAFGMTSPEIAIKLSISPRTAQKHIEHIYRKVGVNNRLSLMRFSQQYMSSGKIK